MSALRDLLDQVRLEPFRWLLAGVAFAIPAWFGTAALLFAIYLGIDPGYCGGGEFCLTTANPFGALAMLLVGAALWVGGVVIARIALVRTPWDPRALVAVAPAIAAAGYLAYTYVS